MCANATAIGAPAPMPIDQGAGAEDEGGAAPPPPPPLTKEDEAIRAALSRIEETPPESERHLAVIGSGTKSSSTLR